jgi:hypothetical protein
VSCLFEQIVSAFNDIITFVLDNMQLNEYADGLMDHAGYLL